MSGMIMKKKRSRSIGMSRRVLKGRFEGLNLYPIKILEIAGKTRDITSP